VTFCEVQDFLADQLGVPNEQIVPSAGLYNDLGADAIEMIDLFLAMRCRWGVAVSFEDAMKIGTVLQLYEYVQSS